MTERAGNWVGAKIVIRVLPNASTRTKNRLRENGPDFRILAHRPCTALGGRDAVLVESLETDWSGWLPLDEVDELTSILSGT